MENYTVPPPYNPEAYTVQPSYTLETPTAPPPEDVPYIYLTNITPGIEVPIGSRSDAPKVYFKYTDEIKLQSRPPNTWIYCTRFTTCNIPSKFKPRFDGYAEIPGLKIKIVEKPDLGIFHATIGCDFPNDKISLKIPPHLYGWDMTFLPYNYTPGCDKHIRCNF